MGRQKFCSWRWLALMAVVFVPSAMGACASSPDRVDWPAVDVATMSPPQADEGQPRLVRGEDGLLYVVGDFEVPPRPGQMIFGAYGGEWPLEETPRPALYVGEVIETIDEGVVQVHGLYEFADTEYDDLKVFVADDRGGESMGKGLDVVEAISGDDEGSTVQEVTFGLGNVEGVQEGDIYAVIRPYEPGQGVQTGQLTRRLTNICRVVDVGAESSTCRLRQGYPGYGEGAAPDEGDFVVFLEPRVATERRAGRILVSQVEDDAVNEAIGHQLESYFNAYPGADVTVEFFDQSGGGPPIKDWDGRGGAGAERWADEEIDARDKQFYRWGRRLETDEPALLVGVNLEGDEVVVNYTGLGGAVGPGMVAAPPEGGVEMGKVDTIGDERWKGFASLLKGTMLVYRGETSEALMHLHEALRQPELSGQWRWHARDQFAMRWAALDHFEEALWLVHEDEAVARQSDDRKAVFNAKGTRVRLHDYVDQPQMAYELARRYLDGQGEAGSRGSYLSALAMFGEMAAQVEEFDEARSALDELHQLCPDGCEGDLMGLLAGMYWAAMDASPDLQDELVEQMVAVGEKDPATSLANARMFQGWNHMRDDDMDWSMVAFREALRRFEEENSDYGAARAKFYLAIALMERDEPQEAYQYASEALQYMNEIGDFMSTARIYERMAYLFVPFDPDASRGLFMAAPQFLRDGFQTQLATGDYGRASEAAFAYGHFLLTSGSFDEARHAFERASAQAIRTARFDMVALSNLFLAMIAEQEGDMQAYQMRIERAKKMAEVADEPFVDELIEEFLSPSAPEQEEDPTQLL